MAASTLSCILLLSGHCDSFSLLLHIIVPFILVYTTRWKQQTISLALLFGIISDKSSNAHDSVIIIHEHAQLEPYHHCKHASYHTRFLCHTCMLLFRSPSCIGRLPLRCLCNLDNSLRQYNGSSCSSSAVSSSNIRRYE